MRTFYTNICVRISLTDHICVFYPKVRRKRKYVHHIISHRNFRTHRACIIKIQKQYVKVYIDTLHFQFQGALTARSELSLSNDRVVCYIEMKVGSEQQISFEQKYCSRECEI